MNTSRLSRPSPLLGRDAMQFNTFVSSTADIDACARTSSVREVLIETKALAREGRLTTSQAVELATYARLKNLSPVLVWDILMTEEEFAVCSQTVRSLPLNTFDAVRVQCMGAARFVKEHLPLTPIQLIAETANCNLPTLQLWTRILGAQLVRIILSIQLPGEKIAEYVRALPVPCEVLGAGRILLFYSRRNLLAKHFGDLDESWREVLAETDRSGNRPYPVIDNVHGTFMYLDKDQYIFHKTADLEDAQPAFLRIDLRHLSEFPESAHDIERIAVSATEQPETLRTSWPRPTIAPFFKSNLTTKQFKRLKSEVQINRDESCVAEVVGAERENHCVMRAMQAFSLPATFNIMDPSGAVVPCEFTSVKRINGTETTTVEADEVVITPWFKRVSPGALLVRA